MKTEQMLRELRYIQKKEEGKFVGTCQTDWHGLLGDVISKIEELEKKNIDLDSINQRQFQKGYDARSKEMEE